MSLIVRECLLCGSKNLQKVDEYSQYLWQYQVWQCRLCGHEWKEEVPKVSSSTEEASSNSHKPRK
jgi:ribosomal protein L37AE/L43A